MALNAEELRVELHPNRKHLLNVDSDDDVNSRDCFRNARAARKCSSGQENLNFVTNLNDIRYYSDILLRLKQMILKMYSLNLSLKTEEKPIFHCII